MNDISFSVCPLRFERHYPDGTKHGKVAVGTGFFWRKAGREFIVSNWHCFSGKDANSENALGTFAPNKVIAAIKYFAGTNESGQELVGNVEKIFDVTDHSENSLVIEHSSGHLVDCALLPVEFPDKENLRIKFLNELDFESRFKPDVGEDCFVVGYPKGFSGKGRTPIWKRASIATEPKLDHGGRPIFLVDTATRDGMSGSPVIVRHRGIWTPSGQVGWTDDTTFGETLNLIGVYAGREGDEKDGFQLGRVWRAHLIDEIVLKYLEMEAEAQNLAT